jgi:hypothetical protein
MLEAYVESWPRKSAPSSLENFRYMLRSGMMGWLSIMIDTTTWDAQHHKAAKEEIQLYKSQLRPLIRDADLYHISQRADGVGWDGIEYFDPQKGRGAIYAFRGSTKTEAKHKFVLRGLDPALRYQIRFHDHSTSDLILGGDVLLTAGLLVQLPIPKSSEIVFLEALPTPVSLSGR